MSARFVYAFAVVSIALLGLPTLATGQDEPAATTKPVIENLGEQRYRIGPITVDKGKRSFNVPGRVIHVSGPMEYLAVTEGGMKEYESPLELAASAIEFQLACILIGLDNAKSVKPRYQFDEREAEGPGVEVHISWESEGDIMRIPASNALLTDDKPFDDHGWVYIGSNTQPSGEFSAEMIGTLIGFVHDPDAIIEHRRGAGIGAYGMMTVNSELLPPEGALVVVSVSATVDKGGEESTEEKLRD